MEQNFLKNLFFMFSYVFHDRIIAYSKNFPSENDGNIYNLRAAVLVNSINWYSMQGLYREETAHPEDGSSAGGKTVLPETIRNIADRTGHILACDFISRVLKTAVVLLLNSDEVDPEYRQELQASVQFLAAVDPVQDPKSVRWSALKSYSDNMFYRPLIILCKLIIDGLLDDRGEEPVDAFLDVKAVKKLFEKFILGFYSRECPQITAVSRCIDWALDDGFSDLLPGMSDIIELSRGESTLIIVPEFSFKPAQSGLYGSDTLRPDPLYRIFSYVKNESYNTANPVHGLLLYASTDGSTGLNHKYSMSGNQIWVRSFNLDRSFKELFMDLKFIAIEHFGEFQG
jgi:5-methylcytosine-specific restriction enzyme subunit McrC